MATTISVNKQSVSEFLKSGRTKPFIIPEYQRPYAWTPEHIEVLFEDIWEFSTSVGGLDKNGSYFLGSIVSFENENGEQEIIDGQQRITSLFLLLRAIYTKLIGGDDVNTDAAQNFIRQIEPAIWRTDNKTGKVDFKNILLTSQVVNNEGNEILRDILETGEANLKSIDNYSINYLLFKKLYDDHCSKSPLKVYDFIYALLNQAILLPISADSQDTALTIFSTLNDRGLPLSDADIFKAKIYNNLPDNEKDLFIQQWQNLEKEATEANESIQQLFYYYMFYLRAKENDVTSTTPGIRKFFSFNKFSRLTDKNLMSDLKLILNLWKVINTNQDIPEENWDNNAKIRKALDTLTSYPNEFWKYPVIIYYLSHRNKKDFEDDFLLFLNKLIGELVAKFLLFPTINAVKADILKLNAKIIKNPQPEFGFKPIDIFLLSDKITVPHRSIVRMLLKIYAYQHQEHLLPKNWQIEHILPQKWQTSFFPNIDIDIINEKIEHIGNKAPFERKLNIIASNGYFKKKQSEYIQSNIEVTKILITSNDNDWTISNIEHRDQLISKEIIELLNSFEDTYVRKQKKIPSADDLVKIEEFKKMGWV